MEPLDIWRIAKVMVEKHGEYAPEECEQQADEFAAAGDGNSEELWENHSLGGGKHPGGRTTDRTDGSAELKL